MDKTLIRKFVLGRVAADIGLRSQFFPDIHDSAEILDSQLDRSCRVGGGGRIIRSEIGPGCSFGEEVDVADLVVSRNLSVGRNTVFARGGGKISMPHGDQCEIGAFCSIAEGLRIIAKGHNYYRPSTYYFQKRVLNHKVQESGSRGMTRIGSDVWIGSGVFIKGGIEVGHGAVIGAMAVVTRDVPPYTIVVGNPARVLKLRFEESIVGRLLALAWWNLPYRILKSEAAAIFFSTELTIESLDVFESYVRSEIAA